MSKRTKFLIRVVYQSGYVHEFWAYSFEMDMGDGSVTWEAVDVKNRPIFINYDRIECVYQVDVEEECEQETIHDNR